MPKEKLVSYQGIGSYCPVSSDDFAETVAGQILTALERYKGGCLEVRGYTPPYDEGCFPAGFLMLILRQEKMPAVCIGVEFGQHDLDDNLARQEFDADAWSRDRSDPHAGGVHVINFDEAWRVVCIVGSRLELRKVSLSYGC